MKKRVDETRKKSSPNFLSRDNLEKYTAREGIDWNVIKCSVLKGINAWKTRKKIEEEIMYAENAHERACALTGEKTKQV